MRRPARTRCGRHWRTRSVLRVWARSCAPGRRSQSSPAMSQGPCPRGWLCPRCSRNSSQQAWTQMTSLSCLPWAATGIKRKKNGKSSPATLPTAKSSASTVIRRTASTWAKRATARPSTSRARSRKQTGASVWAISSTIISQVTPAASKRSCRVPRRRPPSRRTIP